MARRRSWYWVASAGVGAVATATLAVTGIAVAIGDSPSDGKQQALNHPHSLASLPAGSGKYVYKAPTAKPAAGGGTVQAATSPEEVDAVTRSINLLTAYCQLQEVRGNVAERPAAIVAGHQVRSAVMRSVWSAEVVDERIAELTNALDLVAGDEAYQAYSDCSIIADQSTATATLDGLTAAIVFTGHATYDFGGRTKNDPDTQWQVALARPSTTQDWLLVSVGQVDLSGSGR